MSDNLESLIDEAFGRTNKSREAVDRQFENIIIATFDLAVNLKNIALDNEMIDDVEIPPDVIAALDECVKEGKLPLDEKLIEWMESKVAAHNGVEPARICCQQRLQLQGKMWAYYPEVGNRMTGFSYYPKNDDS